MELSSILAPSESRGLAGQQWCGWHVLFPSRSYHFARAKCIHHRLREKDKPQELNGNRFRSVDIGRHVEVDRELLTVAQSPFRLWQMVPQHASTASREFDSKAKMDAACQKLPRRLGRHDP